MCIATIPVLFNRSCHFPFPSTSFIPQFNNRKLKANNKNLEKWNCLFSMRNLRVGLIELLLKRCLYSCYFPYNIEFAMKFFLSFLDYESLPEQKFRRIHTKLIVFLKIVICISRLEFVARWFLHDEMCCIYLNLVKSFEIQIF